ncbi:MAG: HAD-IA family hydrolase [Prevotella sp.]|jgi:HAD superfamily hydrolase (TIGR01509 family)|nr:HAD-IA family hydrolase [Prevotella sp.]
MEQYFKEYLAKNNYEQFDIRAVMFDMDGVLYNSMKYHAKAWLQTMTEHHLPSSYDEFYLHEGRTGGDTINLIMQRTYGRNVTDEEKTAIYKRKSELFSEYNSGETIPYAGDVLKMVKANGLKRVLVTGSGQRSLLDNLNAHFPDIFLPELMVTAFDVKQGKPHPEPYLTGLKKAGNLHPNQAIVIENAPMGVASAVAAGIFTIAVNTGPLPDKVLWDAGANIVLPSMQELLTNRFLKKYLFVADIPYSVENLVTGKRDN